VKIDPRKIVGPWTEGFTLDRHVESSVPIGMTPGGHTQFDTKRTELGELIYQLKYGSKKGALPEIVKAAEDFVRGRWGVQFDVVVPAPPSLTRKEQPVVEIARALASNLGIPTCEDAVVKVKVTPPMKNVKDFEERKHVLQAAIENGKGDIKGKRILLIDDLIESGSTLRRVADVLLKDSGAHSVHALALTRTK
jgi:competence protein ComFC